MDPLSITAAVAGILGVTVNLISTIDGICTAVKKRPALLEEIAIDLQTLQDVVSDLKTLNEWEPHKNAAALNSVLKGCSKVMEQIGQELNALQSALQRGRIARKYAQMTFSSKMESISVLRDQLEKYKSTLIIALNLRTMRKDSSTDSVTDKIKELQQEVVSITRKKSTRPAWLNPIQQYLAASSDFVAPTSDPSASDASQTDTASSITLVDSSTPSIGKTPSITRPDDDLADDINTFGSFDEWVAAFAEEDLGVADGKSDSHSTVQTTRPKDLLPRTNETSLVSITIHGLAFQKNEMRHLASRRLEIQRDARIVDVMQTLHDQGFPRVCGFRVGEKLIDLSTIISREGSAQVVNGQSCYSLRAGLKINVDEPFEVFYDNFIRAHPSDVPPSPMKRHLNTESSRIEIMDGEDSVEPILQISLDRTLRVPEDNSIYGLPALFSPFPLLPVEEYKKTLPVEMVKKSGLVIPMFQREAVALNFYGQPYSNVAVKVLAGTVNTLSGVAGIPGGEVPHQNHIVAPLQARLDGFVSGFGIVRQFISMPLGSGYSAEAQLTGKEVFGGFQLIVAPRFRGRAYFPDYPVQSLTPTQAGLSAGSYVKMCGDAVIGRYRLFALHNSDSLKGVFQNDKLFWHDSTCRPKFVHEMFDSTSWGMSVLETDEQHTGVNVQAVYPMTIYTQMRPHQSYQPPKSYNPHTLLPQKSKLKPGSWIALEVSPFMNFRHLYELLCQQTQCQVIVAFHEGTELTFPSDDSYQPLPEIFKNGSRLYCQGYTRKDMTPGSKESPPPPSHLPNYRVQAYDHASYDAETQNDRYFSHNHSQAPQSYSMGSQMPARMSAPSPPLSHQSSMPMSAPSLSLSPQHSLSANRRQSKPQTIRQRWDMGIAAGGEIRQDVLPDNNPDSWNWHRACFVNIQILNSVIFERMTNQPAPISPITFQDYIKARLPFYHTIEQDSVAGSSILANIKTVGSQDKSKTFSLQAKMRTDSTLVGCVICEKNLADSLLSPCKHIFCTTCIRDNMKAGQGQLICAACRKAVSEVIQFSAPADIPTKTDPTPEKSTSPVSASATTSPSIMVSPPGDKDGSSKSFFPPQELDSMEIAITGTKSNKDKASKKNANPSPESPKPTQPDHMKPEHASPNSLGATISYDHFRKARRTSSSINLHHAAHRGDLSLVKTLLDTGHDPNAELQEANNRAGQKYPNERPAHVAARLGHGNIVYMLYEQNADLDLACGKNGYKVIHEACASGQNATLLLLLGLDVSINSETGFVEGVGTLTPFEVAANHGHESTTNLLFKKGADTGLRFTGKNRTSAIHLAARNGHESVVRMLFKIGFTVDHRWPGGWTPLMEASKSGHVEIMRFLMQQGADMNAADSLEYTPLRCAVVGDHFEAVAYLLAAGANTTGPTPHSPRAIHDAATNGNVDILRLLLDEDTKINPAFENGAKNFEETLVDLALSNGHLECCDFLLSEGAVYGLAMPLKVLSIYPSLSASADPRLHQDPDARLKEVERKRKIFRDFTQLLIKHNAFGYAISRVIHDLVWHYSNEEDFVSELLTHYLQDAELQFLPMYPSGTDEYSYEVDFVDLIQGAITQSSPQVIRLLISAARVSYDDDKWPRTLDPKWNRPLIEAFIRGDFGVADALLPAIPWEANSRGASHILLALRMRKDEMSQGYEHTIARVKYLCYSYYEEEEEDVDDDELEDALLQTPHSPPARPISPRFTLSLRELGPRLNKIV